MDELGRVTDVSGEELRIYPAAREAIAMLSTHEAFAETRVAVARGAKRLEVGVRRDGAARATSRYGAVFEREGVFERPRDDGPAQSASRALEILEGGGRRPGGDIHGEQLAQDFQSLREKTGTPFSDMLFFDNGA